MEKKEIQRQLWDSVEADALRNGTLLATVITLLACGIHRLFNANTFYEINPWAAYLTIIGLVLVPIYLIDAWRLWRIFRQASYYKFYRTKLVNPKGGRIRDTIRFTVLLEDAEGKFVVDTHSIFVTHGFIGPLLEDYVNHTVTIAFNDRTDEVVVIG